MAWVGGMRRKAVHCNDGQDMEDKMAVLSAGSRRPEHTRICLANAMKAEDPLMWRVAASRLGVDSENRKVCVNE